MFKAQTLRRSFSLFRGIPTSTVINTAARNGHQNIQIQRVQFQQRFFTRRRLVGTTLAAVGVYVFLTKLDDIIPDLEEEVEEVEDGDKEDSTLFFFPTGLSRPKKREFYRGSDPEWQEFVQLSRDRTRLERIRGGLVVGIRSYIAHHPSYIRRLGKINPNVGSTWIEIGFPDGPPIEYERPGYELTDELALRKTSRPVEPHHHKRLNHILNPTATATSLFMDTKRRAVMSWVRFKSYLGWKTDGTAATPQTPARISSASASSSPKTPPPDTTSSSAEPSSSTTGITESEKDSSGSSPSSPPPSSSSPSSPTTPSSNPISKRFDTAFPDPTLAPDNLPTMNLGYFRLLFRRYNKPPKFDLTPPRGSIMVHGLVEVIGEKGKSTLDVVAFYNIKTAQYTRVGIKTRSITEYKQRPKGGD